LDRGYGDALEGKERRVKFWGMNYRGSGFNTGIRIVDKFLGLTEMKVLLWM
jgi:hypothetical protein